MSQALFVYIVGHAGLILTGLFLTFRIREIKLGIATIAVGTIGPIVVLLTQVGLAPGNWGLTWIIGLLCTFEAISLKLEKLLKK